MKTQPKDQCNPLNSLDLKHAIFALNQTLQQHENIRHGTYNIDGSNTDELIKHYNCGNLNDIVFNQSTSQVIPQRHCSPLIRALLNFIFNFVASLSEEPPAQNHL